MNGTLEISRVVPTSPERIYNAFLNPHEHSALTGEKATLAPDGSFLARNGQVKARTLRLETARHIVQQWRSKDFPDTAPDSQLEIALSPTPEGTKVSLRQTGLPEEVVENIKTQWNEHYFNRMDAYFHSPASRVREAGETVAHVAEDASQALAQAAKKAQEMAKKAEKQVKQAVKKASQRLKKATAPIKKAQVAAKKGLSKAKGAAKKAPTKLKKAVVTKAKAATKAAKSVAPKAKAKVKALAKPKAKTNKKK